MTARVGAKGQVVIPEELLEQVGLGPGAEIDFGVVDDGIMIHRAKGPSSLRGRFATKSGMAARLLEDRRNERR